MTISFIVTSYNILPYIETCLTSVIAVARPDLKRQALAFIAVPWRKFYRRDFLERNALRFPEGDFFFEDNPFHWAVCLAADSIGFVDLVTCHHRINRPGQTMVSTATELAAFFVHFRTIMGRLSPEEPALRAAAARWLLNNMNWHLARLHPAARLSYATAAAEALALIEDAIWKDRLAATEGHKKIWPVADRLRRGDVWKIVDGWNTPDERESAEQMKQKLQALDAAPTSGFRSRKAWLTPASGRWKTQSANCAA